MLRAAFPIRPITSEIAILTDQLPKRRAKRVFESGDGRYSDTVTQPHALNGGLDDSITGHICRYIASVRAFSNFTSLPFLFQRCWRIKLHLQRRKEPQPFRLCEALGLRASLIAM